MKPGWPTEVGNAQINTQQSGFCTPRSINFYFVDLRFVLVKNALRNRSSNSCSLQQSFSEWTVPYRL